MLTDKEKADYLDDSQFCPYCGSSCIDGGFVQVDGKSAYQTIVCHQCSKEWNDIYILTIIEEMEDE